MISSQLIAKHFNDWLNNNTSENSNNYDILADYNPLKSEAGNNTFAAILNKSVDEIANEDIANPKIRGVLQVGIVATNEINKVNAFIPQFQMRVLVDSSKADSVYKDIEALKVGLSGTVTTERPDNEGTYYFAWGFNTTAILDTVNKYGERRTVLTLTGSVAMTQRTDTIRGLEFGDNMTIDIKLNGRGQKSGLNVISIVPEVLNKVTEDPSNSGRTSVISTHRSRNMNVVMYATMKSDLTEWLAGIMFDDDNASAGDKILNNSMECDLTLNWNLIDDEKTYNWASAIITNISAPFALGQFVVFTISFAKNEPSINS